jgi:DsbC/DsbD-like thiol-disulfide interchange protein
VDSSPAEPTYDEGVEMSQGSMSVSRRTLLGLSAAAAVWHPAWAGDASPWFRALHSRVRVVAGGADADGPGFLAAIAFELDTGFKTYWRTPGESGLPPAFDWSGSENLRTVEVLWPAPSRFEDQGGVAYGYREGVLLPIRAVPNNRAKSVALRLKLDYGVCKEICIPASATLELKVGMEASAYRPAIEEALARVPKPQAVGAAGDLSILAVEPVNAGGKPGIEVAARAPEGSTLFVEAPEGWYLGAGAPRAPSASQPVEHRRFPVEVLERPRDGAGPLELRLTLVAGDRAIETRASLDSARLPP